MNKESYQIGNFVLNHESFIEFKSKIASFNLKDLNKLTYDQVYKEISGILLYGGFFLSSKEPYYRSHDLLNIKDKFYRIRKTDRITSNITEYWSPPIKFVTEFGRLNRSGESVLYTSRNSISIPIKELEIKNDDIVLVTVYTWNHEYTSILKYMGIMNNQYIDKNNLLSKLTNLKMSFISEWLMKKNISNNNIYKVTNSIRRFYERGQDKMIDGYIYPSTLNDKELNTIFYPHVENKNLILESVYFGQITNISDKSIILTGNVSLKVIEGKPFVEQQTEYTNYVFNSVIKG